VIFWSKMMFRKQLVRARIGFQVENAFYKASEVFPPRKPQHLHSHCSVTMIFSRKITKSWFRENVIFCSKMMYPEQSVHVNRVFKVGKTILMFCKAFPHQKTCFAGRKYKKLVIFHKKKHLKRWWWAVKKHDFLL